MSSKIKTSKSRSPRKTAKPVVVDATVVNPSDSTTAIAIVESPQQSTTLPIRPPTLPTMPIYGDLVPTASQGTTGLATTMPVVEQPIPVVHVKMTGTRNPKDPTGDPVRDAAVRLGRPMTDTLRTLDAVNQPVNHNVIANLTGRNKGNQLRPLTAMGLVVTTRYAATNGGHLFSLTPLGRQVIAYLDARSRQQ